MTSRNPVVRSYRDLEVYKTAFKLQQDIFKVSKMFPRDEMDSMTDQMRRSSRAIGANLAEARAKRRYEAHFLSKLTDSDGELQKATHWIDSAFACEVSHRTTTHLSSELHFFYRLHAWQNDRHTSIFLPLTTAHRQPPTGY